MNENIKEIVNIIGNAELSNKCHSDCFINTDFDNECSLCRQATALDKAGYRPEAEVRAQAVKEFAGKVIDGIFSHSGIAQDCSKVLASPEILQDEINDLAEQYGKEADDE